MGMEEGTRGLCGKHLGLGPMELHRAVGPDCNLAESRMLAQVESAVVANDDTDDFYADPADDIPILTPDILARTFRSLTANGLVPADLSVGRDTGDPHGWGIFFREPYQIKSAQTVAGAFREIAARAHRPRVLAAVGVGSITNETI